MSRSSLLFASMLATAGLLGWSAGRLLALSEKADRFKPPRVESVPALTPRSGATLSFGGGDSLTTRIDKFLENTTTSRSRTEITVAAFKLAQTLQADEFAPAIASLGAKSSGAATIAGYWAELDLPAAKQWLEQLPPEAKDRFAPSILDTWSAIDPRAALTWIEQLPEAQRETILRSVTATVAARAGPLEPERVLALLAPVVTSRSTNSEGSITQTGVTSLFATLAQKTPGDAAARALALPSGAMRTEAACGVAREWAKTDPQTARRWAESITDAALAAQVVPACAVGLASKDPRAAAEWVGSLPGSLANLEAMQQVMRAWGGSDAADALVWIDALPNSSDASAFAGEVISECARHDVSAAMQLVLQRAASGQPIGETRALGWDFGRSKGASESLRVAGQLRDLEAGWGVEQIRAALIEEAAAHDRQAALKWALAQPDRAFALSAVAAQFASDDPGNAARWVSALPRDEANDAARQRVAYVIRNEEPVLSMQLQSQMAGGAETRDLMQQTMRLWLQSRRDEAAAWLERSPLFSGEEKARLLATSNRGR